MESRRMSRRRTSARQADGGWRGGGAPLSAGIRRLNPVAMEGKKKEKNLDVGRSTYDKNGQKKIDTDDGGIRTRKSGEKETPTRQQQKDTQRRK